MQLDPDHLATLAAILRCGSFDGAAAELSITPPAVSQRIRALEERIGTTLIERGSPSRGTETGRRLARHAEALALLEQDLARDISGLSPARSTVRIATNADSLALWVIPALAEVPDMLFDLVIDDQDHSGDWLKRGDVAGAITAHATPIRGCNATPLGALRYVACAAPGFIARHFADGVTAPALRAAPALRFNLKDRLQQEWMRRHTGQDITPAWHQIAAVDAFNQAALHGLGWGLIPEPLAAPLLQTGQLRELIPGTPHDVPLYWQVSRLMAAPLKPLTRALRQSAAQVLIG
ncbi:LysR family transcriptional regulator ArgP [Actibacterium ureilyticum]|uniref:LysR family transcriptional regulator ArgP n=1 Tax=Actibacterium ureilyticum TaxID=1590614 RepID=UPI000BAACA9C|nr:LysR family transcriptional regulator ArgP [Actibacterium ureilyticum]